MKSIFFISFLFISANVFSQDFNELVSKYQADKSALGRKYPNHLTEKYFDRFIEYYTDVKKELGPEMKSTGEAIRFIKNLRDPFFTKIYSERNMHLAK